MASCSRQTPDRGFGGSVTVDGTTLVVAIDGNVGAPSWLGRLYVYNFTGGAWAFEQELSPPAGYSLGDAIDLDGDYLLSMGGDTSAQNNRGWKTFVFTRSGSAWIQGELTVPGRSASAEDLFGLSVSISGDTACVGAPGYSPSPGAVYMFRRTGGVWAVEGSPLVPVNIAGAGVGLTCSVSGDTVAIGVERLIVNGQGNTGRTYIYQRTGSTWALAQTLVPNTANSAFGASVALAGNGLVVGATGDYLHPPQAVFFARENGTWVERLRSDSPIPYTVQNGISFGDAVAPALAPILPIGISFYTFQSLSYTIDVWRQRLTPEPSFRKFALFVVFFPQLVAGPIVRANEFLPQLHRKPRVSASEIEWALFRIAKGLLKKVVLGDFIAVYFTDIVFDSPGDYTSLENLLALYAFTLQIYADFSGYSDIAIGVAKLMGFEMPENFDRPYQALDVGEFWRRWHMTLSTWLRDYLFFPLGGSKGSNARTYFNLWATMFLVGMWHGASWNFVVYSNLQGGAVLFNRWNRLRSRTLAAKLALWLLIWPLIALTVYAFGLLVLALPLERAAVLAGIAACVFALIVTLPDAPRKLGDTRRWLIPIHVLLTFHFATLTRVFFRADDLEHARTMIGKLLAFEPHGVREGLFRIQALHDWLREHFADASGTAWFELVDRFAEHGLLYLLVAGLLYHFTPRRWVDELLLARFRKLPGWALGLLFAAISLLLMHLLDGPRANIYFSF